jgi:hypothetical protein
MLMMRQPSRVNDHSGAGFSASIPGDRCPIRMARKSVPRAATAAMPSEVNSGASGTGTKRHAHLRTRPPPGRYRPPRAGTVRVQWIRPARRSSVMVIGATVAGTRSGPDSRPLPARSATDCLARGLAEGLTAARAASARRA